MDIVYILGKGSKWDNNEIRYSLKSLKYLKNKGNIYVIGEPIEGARHIPYKDNYNNPCINIKDKIFKAATTPEISEDFFFMNDDFFFTRETDAENYPNYCKGDLRVTINHIGPDNEYKSHVKRTIEALEQKGLPMWNFDIHKPMIMNKAKIIEMIPKFNWHQSYGLTFKSIYGNYNGLEPVMTQDIKLSTGYSEQKLNEITSDLDMFSIGDRGLTKDFKRWIEKRYCE